MKSASSFLYVSSICFFSFFYCLNSFAALPVSAKPGKPITQWSAGIKAADFLKFSVAEFNEFTGRKMSTWQKLSFKVLKIKLKREVKKNPELTMADFYRANKKMATGWIILLAVLSTLMLLLLIFLIAYGSAG